MKTLDELISQLRMTNTVIKTHQEQKLQIESDIYALVQPQLTKLGTNTINDQLKVVTKQTTSWDQEALKKLSAEIPSNLFPFKTEFKPESKTLSALASINPDVHAKIMGASTVKDAKPSFELSE